jgi:anti-sigma B factor antagonist
MAGADGIRIDSTSRTGTVVVAPVGDVDMSRSPDLRQALREVISRRPQRVIVDLGEVGYMDSSGLATLVEAMRQAKTARTSLVLCAMTDKVRAIFEIARLHQFFIIAPTLDQAAGV